MKKRKSGTFATALSEAKRDLAKANKRKAAAQAELAACSVEIPALQRTIAALQGQVEGTPAVPLENHIAPTYGGIQRTSPSLTFTDVVPLPQDLTGMGSIPATGVQPPARELTDDELLIMPTAEDIMKTAPKKEDDADPFTDSI